MARKGLLVRTLLMPRACRAHKQSLCGRSPRCKVRGVCSRFVFLFFGFCWRAGGGYFISFGPWSTVLLYNRVDLTSDIVNHFIPYTTVCVYRTPLERSSKLDCSTTERVPVPHTERYVCGKLSARRLQRRPCWHRPHSSCVRYRPWTTCPGVFVM